LGCGWNRYPMDSTLEGPLMITVSLSDVEVLALAQAKMSLEQSERLGELQARGKAVGLSDVEQSELLGLLEIYQLGMLWKAAAIEEAYVRQLPLVLAS
jgi:hypothetical protein